MSQTIGFQITMRDGRSRDSVFDTDSILIGSGPSAVLRLEDSEVSSIHAVVKATADAVTIIDLGSEAGTVLNGVSITEPARLKLGDEIVLGRVRILVTQLGADRLSFSPTTLSGEETVRASSPVTGAVLPSLPSAPPPPPPPLPSMPSALLSPAATSTHHQAAADLTAGEPPTQVVREKFVSGHGPSSPSFGTKTVTEESPLDLSVLAAPLPEENRPTPQQRVLQVTILWGDEVIDAAQAATPRPLTVGGRNNASWVSKNFSARRAFDLEVEGSLPAESFTLAVNRGSEAQVVIPTNAQIALRTSEGKIVRDLALSPTDAPFPAKAYTLQLDERLAFKTGTLTFVVQYVRGDVALGRRGAMDWYFPRVFTISALLHVFFVVAAYITPSGSTGLVDDLLKNQGRFAQMILKAPEKEKERKKLDLSGMKGGAKHKGEEGKFGKKNLPKKDALASKAGAPRVDPRKTEKDRKIALNSGLLGLLKGAGGESAVSNVFGPGGLGTGINNAMGGLRGSAMGDAGGAGGLGTRGTGAGGGGNSLGIGGLGTHGHGRGTGGAGNIDLGGRGKGTTRIVPGHTIVKGSLSKEEIGRVIRRNLARFKYCYEKQLTSNPNLQGKVSIYFTIAPTGAVAQASVRESTIKDSNVENCAATVMRSLKFPQPRGGGIVVVTYPFVFAST